MKKALLTLLTLAAVFEFVAAQQTQTGGETIGIIHGMTGGAATGGTFTGGAMTGGSN